MSWKEKASEKIIALSENKEFYSARAEWNYIKCIDKGNNHYVCQLCNQKNIRYLYEIANKYNNNKMYVGSSCINQFEIVGISENGLNLSKEETSIKVNEDTRKYIEQIRQNDVKRVLEELAKKDKALEATVARMCCKKKKEFVFTPNEILFLNYNLHKNNITFCKDDFKMSIKRKKEREQLLGMGYKAKYIMDYMTQMQKDSYYKNMK